MSSFSWLAFNILYVKNHIRQQLNLSSSAMLLLSYYYDIIT